MTDLRIDFISDVSCPWCAIGLKSLELALSRIQDRVKAELHFQPFELNPTMPIEGQDIDEHISQKYGSTPEQNQLNRDMIRERGRAVGFDFRLDKRARIYNTFDAHRLLHWAESQGRQRQLKWALFKTYFTEGENPSDHDVLVAAARHAGLDPDRARHVLASDAFASEVRDRENFYTTRGIHSVPAIIINDRHLISGGQPADVFERALLQIAGD